MNLIFSDNYFMDEVRDGFYVSSVMKKAWAVSMKRYYDLAEECEKNGIRCWGTWGTLLGAVRCGGYIPWDDDLDTEMFREEYAVLDAVAHRNELAKGYYILDYMETEEQNLARRWSNSEDIITKVDEWKDNFGFPFLNSIDIFIVDDVPTEDEENRKYRNIIREISIAQDKIIELDQTESKSLVKKKELNDRLAALEKLLGCHFDKGNDKPLLPQLLSQYERFISHYNGRGLSDCAIVSYYMSDPCMLLPKRLFQDYIDVPFEEGLISIPIGYDGILRRLFGNYMYPDLTFDGHRYPFYEGFENAIRENTGIEFMHYHLFEPQIEKIVSGFKKSESLSLKIQKACESLLEAHQYIRDNGFEMRDDTNTELLVQCQELAVEIGNFVEKKAVEPEPWIKDLEAYCELVYQLHGWFSQDNQAVEDDAFALLEQMDESVGRIVRRNEEGIQEKIEIVFMPIHSGTWDSLDGLWREFKDDKLYNVSVVPIPYYMRDFEGGIKSENMILEMTGFPDNVERIRFDEYDFEGGLADIAIIQNPYDDFSDVFSVHPFFYTSNLKKYIQNIVLIPEFTIREIVKEDIRGRKMIANYLRTPGIVFSDMIFVQSESMRDVCVEILDEYVHGELGDDIPDGIRYLFDWNGKIRGTGSPLNETNIRKQESGETNKSVIAYFVSGSQLFESETKGIEKMESVLDYLALRRDDVSVVLFEDPFAKRILEQNSPDIWEDYKEVIRKHNNFEIDDSYDAESVARRVDAMYGDGGVLMNHCRIHGKPVLFEKPDVMDFVGSEGYREKQWNDEILIADENEWCLGNFVDEVCKYQPPKSQTGISFAIKDAIERELLFPE